MKNKNKRIPVEKFFSIRTITSLDLSPDGKTIFYVSNTTGTPQIWSIPIKGGWTDQITSWKDSVRTLIHNPKYGNMIFLSDTKGDENLQIYSVNDDGSEVKYLSEGFENSQCTFSTFNKKGTKFLFVSNKRLKYNFDNYIKDISSGTNTLIKEFEDHYPTIAESWSDDERFIIFIKAYGNINTDILLFDTKENTLTNITEHDINNKVLNARTVFNKSSSGFYYLSDEDREFRGIKYYDIKSKKSEWVITEKWDVEYFTFSKKQKHLLWITNKYGSCVVKIKNMKTGKVQKLNIQKGVISAAEFTKDNKELVFIFNNPQNPGDIYVYDIAKKSQRQITNSFVGGVSKNNFSKPRDIIYSSFDGLKIHALLYIPHGTEKNGKNPAIVWPHGGPEYQEMHNFSRYIQVMVNAGYIVIAPNFRGSTGYGKTFQKLIYRDWGGNEFKDVLGSAEYLKKSGYVDPGKIAVVGGSFGGFMCLTCITKAPELWKCAVDIFGPSDLFTFINSVPEHWKMGVNELVGNNDSDSEMLRERSPINFVDRISCPLLVVQGKHDPRVVQHESEQIVNKLKSQNKPVEYILLEDEGHGFNKVSNQIKVFEAKLNFLDKYLK